MQQRASISSTAGAFGRHRRLRDALLRLVGRKIALHQVSQGELSRLNAVEDGPSSDRGEIGQPNHAADVRSRTAVLSRRLIQRLAVTLHALLQQLFSASE